jgi:hypothetical protein
MKAGVSQKEAARQAGVSAETLRRFQKTNTTSRRKGRRWLISDNRPVSVVMATKGKMRSVTVSHDAASDISRHWTAINHFLDTNSPTYLAAFVGKGLRGSNGVFHPFETRPNVLWKLDSSGELNKRTAVSFHPDKPFIRGLTKAQESLREVRKIVVFF